MRATTLVFALAAFVASPTFGAPLPTPRDSVADALASKMAFIEKQLGRRPVPVYVPDEIRPRNPKVLIVDAEHDVPAVDATASPVATPPPRAILPRYPPQFTSPPPIPGGGPIKIPWLPAIPIKVIPTAGPIHKNPVPVVINPKNRPTSPPAPPIKNKVVKPKPKPKPKPKSKPEAQKPKV